MILCEKMHSLVVGNEQKTSDEGEIISQLKEKASKWSDSHHFTKKLVH